MGSWTRVKMTRMNGKGYCWEFHRQTPNRIYAFLPSLYRVLSKYLSPCFFFFQWFLSFISALMFGPSLTINLAGTALKGPKRKPKHTTRSLDTIDTAICQAPRASGRDVLQCSSGQLVDCGTLIITLLKPEHQPLYEPSDITYG